MPNQWKPISQAPKDGTMIDFERIGAAVIGAAICALPGIGLWHFGHDYTAMFWCGVVFQNLVVWIVAALGIGPLRFRDPLHVPTRPA